MIKPKPLYIHMYNQVHLPFGGQAVVHVRTDINKWIRDDAELFDTEPEDYKIEPLYVKIGEEDGDN